MPRDLYIAPYRRLADQFYKAARGKQTPEELRRLGSLIDRNFEEIPLGGGGVGEIIIDFGDIILVGPSKAFVAREALTLESVLAVLFVSATSDVVIDVLKNGVTVGTVTIPAGDQTAELTLDLAFAVDDYWQMRVTNAGTGGAGLTVQGKFD